MFGGGVVQAIDAAAMDLYSSTAITKARSPGSAVGNPTFELDDLDVVMTGGIIQF